MSNMSNGFVSPVFPVIGIRHDNRINDVVDEISVDTLQCRKTRPLYGSEWVWSAPPTTYDMSR